LGHSGIYIHIPFCRKKCNYCDFYLITNLNIVYRYLKNLETELKLQSEFYKKDKFDTIFLGGGTPSLLTPEQLDSIIQKVKQNYNIENDSEITIESNPDDFADSGRFKLLKETGINRISFGVQSFNEDELKFLTR
jgi:oxygen-independent coproporphyrinogen-3 oxidase